MSQNISAKRSSTISAATALRTLQSQGYKVAQHAPGTAPAPKATSRHAVAAARAVFGPNVMTSKSGQSVTLEFNNQGETISVFVPVKGMLSQEELKAIQQKTGVVFANA